MELQSDISIMEHPVYILGREEKRLRNKVIPLVKVQWNRHGTEEASWKREEDMRRDYPQLFEEEVYLEVLLFILFFCRLPGKLYRLALNIVKHMVYQRVIPLFGLFPRLVLVFT